MECYKEKKGVVYNPGMTQKVSVLVIGYKVVMSSLALYDDIASQ